MRSKRAYLTGRLEQVGVTERRAQAEDVVPLGVFGDGLHDGPVHDDEVFGRRLHRAALARIARVEQQRRALQAHPVALPAALPRQLDLVFLPQKPFLHAEESATESI